MMEEIDYTNGKPRNVNLALLGVKKVVGKEAF